MKLLVTGAAGFIGANFVRHWSARHPDDDVIAVDALTYAGNRANLDGVDCSFVHADIGDLSADVLRGVDVVVNFAAESHNSLAVLDPGRFFSTNVLATQRLLEAARQAGVGRFHHVSTCEVYGDLALDSPSAFTEESPYRPRTPYNASKAGADHAVRAYHETYNVGSGVEVSAADLASRLLAALDLPTTLIETVDDRPGHDRRYLLDSGKLRRELGWEPLVEFDEGLAATVAWYASHRSWWEPLLDRSPVNEAAWASS